MASPPQTLVYLLYGDKPEYHLELSYSLLSAVQHQGANAPRIILFTDEKTRRDDLPIEHSTFTAAEFARWTEDGKYLHGAKAGAFLSALDRFGGKVALIDTDTFFMADPAHLFGRIDSAHAVMHADEGTLSWKPAIWQPIFDHYACRTNVPGGPITRDSAGYNSGVLGVEASARPLIEDVVPLIRKLNEIAPAVVDVEQFAFTHVLQGHFALLTCDDIVHHYWGYERRFIHARIRALFPNFSKSSFADALGRREKLTGFPQSPKFNIIRARVKRMQRRQHNTYMFPFLAYLNAFAAKNEEDANAWAATALDAISYNKFPADIVRRDFARLRGRGLANFSPVVRDRWNSYWTANS